MRWRTKLARWVADHHEQPVSAGIVVAVVGASLALETHSILTGAISAVLTAIGMWALWPLIKRWG